MKKAIVALSLAAACSVTPHIPLDLPGIPREVDPSIQLLTPEGGGGHACPVEGKVFTARHVMWDEKLKTFVPAAWSFQGGTGAAEVVQVAQVLDLVMLRVEGDAITYLPKGKAKVGDLVFWFEYDFRTRENALRARRRFAKILRFVAGHAIMDDVPVAGGSGSCLINSNGEVVGIISASFDTDDGLGAGVAVLLPDFPREQ